MRPALLVRSGEGHQTGAHRWSVKSLPWWDCRHSSAARTNHTVIKTCQTFYLSEESSLNKR